MKSDETLPADSPSSELGSVAPGPRVIVVGSSNLDLNVSVPDLPTPGQTVIGTSLSRLPGGKGANQAVAAARAGAAVAFVSAVGADDAGRLTIESLTAEGIDATAVLTHPTAPTGTAIVLVGDDGENEIAIVQGANAELSGDDVRRALIALRLGPMDVVLVSFEITDEAVTAAAQCAAEARATLFVNPAPARPLDSAITDAHPVLLPNSSEAQSISGTAGDEDGARRLHAMTGAPVIVTLGGAGVLLLNNEVSRIPPLPTTVVDTTGAGDTFAGILAARTAAGDELRQAVRWAVAGAAISVATRGAREGSPALAEIEVKLAESDHPTAATSG